MIDDRELRAWVHLAPDDERPRSGPLADLTCGIKDIIDVAGMPTAFGVEFRVVQPERDAWCVARLREAGARIAGKTETTAFAFLDPAVTRNPWHRDRTPGGSSAGSAAAVAAGHVAFALGTQTRGSVLRPASFCGVVGFKPSYGAIPIEGVWPLARSLDHVGILARDVKTVARVAAVLMPGLAAAESRAPRVRVDVTLYCGLYGRVAHDAALAALNVCAAHGAILSPANLASFAERANAVADAIMAYEMHEALGFLLEEPQAPPSVLKMVRLGATLSRETYEQAIGERERLRGELPALFAEVDALAVLCAGPAPPRETTGAPPGQTPWTLLGLPAISLPIGFDVDGLPLSIQLVGPPAADAALLSVAAWGDRTLGN